MDSNYKLILIIYFRIQRYIILSVEILFLCKNFRKIRTRDWWIDWDLVLTFTHDRRSTRRKSRATEPCSRSHGDDSRTQVLHCLSLLPYDCCSVLDFRSSLACSGFRTIRRKIARKKIYGKTLASLTRFTSAGPDPHAQLCCFSGILPAIRYSFSLSFRLLPSSQLSRTTAGTYTVSSSRSCSSCLFLTRPVLPRDHCFLGPRCCQIVRESHGRKASTVLHSLALSPLPISLCLYKSSCICTNLAVPISLKLISI